MTCRLILAVAAAMAVCGCTSQRKLEAIRSSSLAATLALSAEFSPKDVSLPEVNKDTLQVQDFDGHQVLIMKAVRDEDGEMVATDVIDAAYVTARFRNIAERHGRVDLRFEVIVPKSMQDSRWQLRFYPRLTLSTGDSTTLESVVITGSDYRKAQLRGYQQYDRFIRSIITDTTKFIRTRPLEIFLRRNIPQLYSLKTDTTFVSDEKFASLYGVTEQEAVEHYTDRLRKRRNEWKKRSVGRMYRKYIKVPIVTDGLRLDTVMTNFNGDFIYEYVQVINVTPKLRKADITLDGEIYEEDRQIYTIPRSDPLSFYISSLSTLVDDREKYLTSVIGRRVEANTACYIDFAVGKWNVDENLSNNRTEIGRIKDNLKGILDNSKFDLDSIVVTAYASPEGSEKANGLLSQKRAEAVSDYFGRYVRQCNDSLARETGLFLDIDDDGRSERMRGRQSDEIRFISHNGGENWAMLDRLVEDDTTISRNDKDGYWQSGAIRNADAREKSLQRLPSYIYIRKSLYPKLRIVRFDLCLHRKGMVKDTVHTTVLDSTYAAGVRMLKERDYEGAVKLLGSYGDYNTAVAYVALDRNRSARQILEGLDMTAQVDYLLAIICSREGDDRSAVEHYLHACRQDRQYVHRGNLDPEIFALITRYDLNFRDD